MITLQQAHDTDLIRDFQNGNDKALEVLINRHSEKIFSTIFYLTKDRCLAEDMFQEVFIKIIDTFNSGRYNDEGKFLQWALRIAHNLCVDYFRKIKRVSVMNSNDTKVFEMHTETSDEADTTINRSQTNNKLHAMLELLPPEQREVIVLRHFSDLSFKEIAAMTDTSINTALGRMRYGLMNLRKIMHQHQMVL